MKNVILINGLAVVLAFVSSFATGAEEGEATPQGDEGNLEHDIGYFFGYSFGNILKQGGNEEADLDGIMAGMKDSLQEKYPALSREQQEAVMAVVEQNRQRRMEEEERAREIADAQQGEVAEQNLAAANEFLAENGERDGVMSTDSGLQYQILEEGSGASPVPANTVRVNYEGKLLDGTVFDSTDGRDPVEFGLRQVIPGWTEGLQLAKEGGRIRLFIPPELAYGPAGQGPIPPNSLLIFDVELLDSNVNN